MNCKKCRWYEIFYEIDEEERGLCNYPRSRLPLSMAGFT